MFVRIAAALALAVVFFFHFFGYLSAFRWLEAGSYDARVRWAAPHEQPDPSIVILDIDNASFDILKDKLGRWPWTRRVWTETIRYVAKGNPKVIALDAKFGGQETPEVDKEFAQVIHHSGNVVLAFSFDPATVEKSADETRANMAVLGRERKPWREGIASEWYAAADVAPNVPLATLADAAAGLGCINTHFDRDGVVRRVPMACRVADGVYRSFPVATAEIAASHHVHAENGRFGIDLASPSDTGRLDDESRLILRWRGANPYQRIPLWRVICSIYPDQCPNNDTKYSPEFFKDKIVLLGASFSGSFELHPTPFNGKDVDGMPGIVVHATAIDDILHGNSTALAPNGIGSLMVVLMAVAGTAIIVLVDNAILESVLVLVVALGFTALDFVAFRWFSLWLPLTSPLIAFGVCVVGSGVARFATTGRDLRRTRAALDRYMSPQLVAHVMEHPEYLSSAGEHRELTIFFSDIRSFTTLTEKSDPRELIALLNDYLSEMTDVIFKYDGVVDKFIGDGILAHWGAFNAGRNHAELAARASLEMLERLRLLNERGARLGRPPIAIGIGLNSGEVVFGNVGAGKKIELTVIGDPVNLASRLEGLNKEFKTSIIISEFTRARLGELAQVRPLGGVKVKGKTVETEIFELQGLREGSTASQNSRSAAHE